MVFQIAPYDDRAFRKILREAAKVDGVECLAPNRKKSLLTVTCTSVDAPSLIRRLRKKSGLVELISHGRRSNGGGDDDGKSGGGDKDGNGGGGGNNKKKERGGCGDSDGNDQDKAGKGGGGGSGGNTEGGKMDFMGEAGFDYRYGYHGGSENGCPTGQLPCLGRLVTTEILC